MLDGGSLRVREWIEIDRDDSEPIRELLCDGSQRDDQKHRESDTPMYLRAKKRE